MTTYFRRAWRILMLDPGELRQHVSEPNAMAVSLSLAVVAGLIAGLGELTGVGADLTQPSAAERAQQSASAMAAIPGSLPEGIAGIVEPITSEVSMVLTKLSTALESVEPPLGAQTSQVLRSFGAWLAWGAIAMAFGILLWATRLARQQRSKFNTVVTELETRSRQLGLLRELAGTLLKVETMQDLFDEVVKVARALFEAEGASVS